MKLPGKIVKGLVNSVKDWVDKADREHQEQVMEVLKPPTDERLKDDKLKRGAAHEGNMLDLSTDSDRFSLSELEAQHNSGSLPAPAAPPMRVPATPDRMDPRTTPPKGWDPTRPAPVPATPSSLGPPPAPPALPAGMKERSRGDVMDSGEQIVQNQRNDTVYNQRNELVAMVQERYAKYGESIAAAILTKIFMPNGLDMLLQKIGLKTRKNQMQDHDQVLAFIEAQGIEAFCQRVGIRFDAEKAREERRKFNEQEKRRRTEESSSKRVNTGASSTLQLKEMNFKPINLPAGEKPPEAAVPPPAPATERKVPSARNLPPAVNPVTPRQLPKSSAPKPLPPPVQPPAQPPSSPPGPVSLVPAYDPEESNPVAQKYLAEEFKTESGNIEDFK